MRHTAARSQLLCPEPCCIGHRGLGDVEEVVGMKKAAVSGCVVEEEVGGDTSRHQRGRRQIRNDTNGGQSP